MNGIERVGLNTAVRTITTGKQLMALRASECERFFNGMLESSGGIGMKINSQKTQLLCVSPAGSNEISAQIKVGDTTAENLWVRLWIPARCLSTSVSDDNKIQ